MFFLYTNKGVVMKIGCISDLHIKQDNSEEYCQELISYYITNNLDLLLIAGDISENPIMTIEFVKSLNIEINVKYVPGNHDLWNKNGKYSTENSYQLFLADSNCLLNKCMQLTDEYCIVGHIGWYDYSLGENYDEQQFAQMSLNKRTWNDVKYIDWKLDNKQICDNFNVQIEQLINKTDKKVILLTHMISHPNFKVNFDPKRSGKDYFNAFLGSLDLHYLTHNPQVKYAICGHVHYRQTIYENDCKYILPCLCSSSQWMNFNQYSSLKKQLQTTIETITI